MLAGLLHGVLYAYLFLSLAADLQASKDAHLTGNSKHAAGISDAVIVLTELAEPIMEAIKAAAGRDMASRVRRALHHRPDDSQSDLLESDFELSKAGTEALESAELVTLDYSEEDSPRGTRTALQASRKLHQSPASAIVETLTLSRLPLDLPPGRQSLSIAFQPQSLFPPTNKQQTRLATLFPGAFEDRLVCSIRAVRVNELRNQDYEAVSYVWNFEKQAEDEVLIVPSDSPKGDRGSHGIWLRQNVARCLRQVRDKDKAVVIWIDVLCTDLFSTEEKSRFENYAKVYAEARKVQFWIGEDDSRIKRTIDWVKDLVRFKLSEDLDLLPASAPRWVDFLNFMHLKLVRIRSLELNWQKLLT